jgi:hypothetical protein
MFPVFDCECFLLECTYLSIDSFSLSLSLSFSRSLFSSLSFPLIDHQLQLAQFPVDGSGHESQHGATLGRSSQSNGAGNGRTQQSNQLFVVAEQQYCEQRRA